MTFVTIDSRDLERRIAEKQVPEIPVELDRVSITPTDDGKGLSVFPVWKHVDRPQSSGWGLPNTPSGRKLAARLKAAIEAGKALTAHYVTRDNGGQTYVHTTHHVMGRYMNADLTRLGF